MMGLKLKKLELDFDIADSITVATLKAYRKSLKKHLKDHKKGEAWLHPDDVPNLTKTIEALDIVISDFTVDDQEDTKWI
jgi:hypothetical protein